MIFKKVLENREVIEEFNRPVFESIATYAQIKEYLLEKFNFKGCDTIA